MHKQGSFQGFFGSFQCYMCVLLVFSATGCAHMVFSPTVTTFNGYSGISPLEIAFLNTATLLYIPPFYRLVSRTISVLTVVCLFLILLKTFERLCGDRLALMNIVIAAVWIGRKDWPACIGLRYFRAWIWKTLKYRLDLSAFSLMEF